MIITLPSLNFKQYFKFCINYVTSAILYNRVTGVTRVLYYCTCTCGCIYVSLFWNRVTRFTRVTDACFYACTSLFWNRVTRVTDPGCRIALLGGCTGFETYLLVCVIHTGSLPFNYIYLQSCNIYIIIIYLYDKN